MIKGNRLNLMCLIAVMASLVISLSEYFVTKAPTNNGLMSDVAALVNDNEIKSIDYLTATAMIEEDKRGELTIEDYQLVIDRLIEEELLFQYGLENGIIYQVDISKKIIDNMLANVFSDITSTEKTDQQVKAFYDLQMQNNPAFSRAMEKQSFQSIKLELAEAMIALEKNAAIRNYIKILQNKASIQYNKKSHGDMTEKLIKLREAI